MVFRESAALAALACLLAAAPAPAGHYEGGKFGPAVYVPDLPEPPKQEEKAGKKLSLEDMWKRFYNWSEELRKRIETGNTVGPTEFDKFFNEDYFQGDYDSIKELHELRRELAKSFSVYHGGTELQRSLNAWTQQRLGRKDFKVTVSEMANRVVMTITVPDLDKKSVSLNITETAVLLSFARAKEGSAGHAAKDPYAKVYPVPDSAQAGSEKVSVSGNAIRIIFQRK